MSNNEEVKTCVLSLGYLLWWRIQKCKTCFKSWTSIKCNLEDKIRTQKILGGWSRWIAVSSRSVLTTVNFRLTWATEWKPIKKTNKKMKGIISNNMLGYRIKPTVQKHTGSPVTFIVFIWNFTVCVGLIKESKHSGRLQKQVLEASWIRKNLIKGYGLQTG